MTNIIIPGFTPPPLSRGKVEEGELANDTLSSPDLPHLPFSVGMVDDGKLANATPSSPLKQAGRVVRLPTAKEPNHIQYDSSKAEKFSLGKWPVMPGIAQDVASFSEAIARSETSEALNNIIASLQENITSIIGKCNDGKVQQKIDSKQLIKGFESLLTEAHDKLKEMENSSEKGSGSPKLTQLNTGLAPPFSAHSSMVSSQLSLPQAAQNTTIPFDSSIEKFQEYNKSIPPSAEIKQPAVECSKTVQIGRCFSSDEQAELLSRFKMDIRDYYTAIQSQKGDHRPLMSRIIYGTKTPGIQDCRLTLLTNRKIYSIVGRWEKISNRIQEMSAEKKLKIEQYKALSRVIQMGASTSAVERLCQNHELMDLAQSTIASTTNLKEISFFNDSDQALIETIPVCCRAQFSVIVNFNNLILRWDALSIYTITAVFMSSNWLNSIEDTITKWNLANIDDVNIHVYHWFKDNRIKVRNVKISATAQILVDLLLIFEKHIQEDIENENSNHHKKNGDGRHKEQNKNEEGEQQKDDDESLSEAILKKLAKLKNELQKIIEIQWQDPRATAGNLEKISQEMSTLIPNDKRSFLPKELIAPFEKVNAQLLVVIRLMQEVAAERAFQVIQTDPSIGAAITAQL